MLFFTLIIFCGWIFSVCFHEFGHAIVAYWGGDTTVKAKGYLTLNPLKYTDITLSLVIPVLFLALGGVALPGGAVYVNYARLRHRFWCSAVSAAGPLASMIVALLLTGLIHWDRFQGGLPPWLVQLGLLPLPPDKIELLEQTGLEMAIALLILLVIASVILNLIPIPPLDGYGIVEPWLPLPMQIRFRQWGKYGVFVLFGILWVVPAASELLWITTFKLSRQLRVNLYLADQGFRIFQQGSTTLLVVAIIGLIGIRQIQKRQIQKRCWSTPESQLNKSSSVVQDSPPIRLNPKLRGSGDRQTIYHQASVLCEQERYLEALQLYEKAIFDQPDFFAAWYQRGRVLAKLQHFHRAISSFDQALSLAPSHLSVLGDKAIALFELEDYSQALTLWNEILDAQPEDGVAYYNRACCLTKLEQLPDALADLQRAIQYGGELLKKAAQKDGDLEQLREQLNHL